MYWGHVVRYTRLLFQFIIGIYHIICFVLHIINNITQVFISLHFPFRDVVCVASTYLKGHWKTSYEFCIQNAVDHMQNFLIRALKCSVKDNEYHNHTQNTHMNFITQGLPYLCPFQMIKYVLSKILTQFIDRKQNTVIRDLQTFMSSINNVS